MQNPNPPRYRRTLSVPWLKNGGKMDDLMASTGWETVAMPLLYAEDLGMERVAASHPRISPGDLI